MANICSNPSFAVDTSPWQQSGGTLTRITTDGQYGTSCGRMLSNATANLNFFSPTTAEFAASVGQVWSSGIWVKWDAGTQRQLRLDILFRDGSTDLATHQGTATTVGTGTWVQLKNENRTAPTGTQFIRLRLVGLSAVSGDAYKIDGVQIEQGATLPAYNEQVILSPPTGLVATAASSTQINLTWNAVTGATSYDIERDGGVVQFSHGSTSYSDTGLSPNTTYTYRVRAVE